MFADLEMLEPALKMNQKPSTSWRSSSEYNRPVLNGLKPGCMNISPAWFEQGHEVLDYFYMLFYLSSSRLSSQSNTS
jgi:hypothetical protein